MLVMMYLQASVEEKEREAAAAGQEGFLKDEEVRLKKVNEEWSALRCTLRRRLGAARTLLLTDGACRLHAVPSDRLEQVAGRHLVFLLYHFNLERWFQKGT